MRPPNILKPVRLTTMIPEDTRSNMDVYLWSPIERRIPHGAYSRFITALVNQYFEDNPEALNDSIARNKRHGGPTTGEGWPAARPPERDYDDRRIEEGSGSIA